VLPAKGAQAIAAPPPPTSGDQQSTAGLGLGGSRLPYQADEATLIGSLSQAFDTHQQPLDGPVDDVWSKQGLVQINPALQGVLQGVLMGKMGDEEAAKAVFQLQ